MVDKPGLAVRVEIADEWEASGPSSERALAIAKKAVEGTSPECRRTLRVIVEECPPEHIGLGVGTQLSMAVNDAVALELYGGNFCHDTLAYLAGRGERSRRWPDRSA